MGYCVKITTYLINRVPSTILNNVSPYVKLYNRQPFLAHFRILGCLCHVKILHEQDKLMPRTKPAIHMEYFETKKGYILFDITNKSFSVHREVTFREGIFSFKSIEHIQPHSVPTKSQDLAEENFNTASTTYVSPIQTSGVSPNTSDVSSPSHNEIPAPPLVEAPVILLNQYLEGDPAEVNNHLCW